MLLGFWKQLKNQRLRRKRSKRIGMICHFKMIKEHLDIILNKHKAQPMESGYVDIIIRRENYQNLIQDFLFCDLRHPLFFHGQF